MTTSRRRRFTDDEKRMIVDDAMARGINVVLQEHRLSYSAFARWKKQFYIEGNNASLKKTTQRMVQQFNKVIIENEQLKKIIANLMLELQIKSDEVKTLTKMKTDLF